MIQQDKDTEGGFYKKILESSISREVFNIIEGIEFINFDLLIKQRSMVENYYRFLISKAKYTGLRARVNASIYSKNLSYGLKNYKPGNRNKYYGYSTGENPLSFTTEFNYSLDFWNENNYELLSSSLELVKMVEYYRFSVKYKKYETLCEYWDIYLARTELEVIKKRLKRQKQLLTEFHFRNYFGNTNYEGILHSILDLKIQLNGFKQDLNIFNRKVQQFINKNGIDCLYLKYTSNLFNFNGMGLNNLWGVFNKVNTYEFIPKARIFKNKSIRDLRFLILKEITSIKKNTLRKIPQIEFALSYEKDFFEKKVNINNIKGSYEKTDYSPRENIFISMRSLINLNGRGVSFRDNLIRVSKLKRMLSEYEYKSILLNVDQEFILKKACVFKRELIDLKTKLLVKLKVLNYRKKTVFKSKFEVNKWRDLEVVYLSLNIKLQKKIIEYFKLLMQLNINTL